MVKRAFILILAVFLLSGCSSRYDDSDISVSAQATPIQTRTPVPTLITPTPPASATPEPTVTLSPKPSHTQPSTLDYTPVLKVAAAPVEGRDIINSRKTRWEDDPYVFIYADEPVYDLLISRVTMNNEDWSIEEVAYGPYVPELTRNQSMMLVYPYPSYDEGTFYKQIAYTNSQGEYEVVLVYGDDEQADPAPTLVPIAPYSIGQAYNEEYLLCSTIFFSKMQAGAFEEHVPKGFCIAGGDLGDVNGDGLEDALLYIVSNNRRADWADYYHSEMPLYVLLGQPEGGYALKLKLSEVLFTPYKSASYPEAGNGYIDIIYSYVGGASCHHKEIYRFRYDEGKDEWLLEGIYYQPSSHYYTGIPDLAFVQPLPSYKDLPLTEFTDTYYTDSADWDYFDSICELIIPGELDHIDTYKLAIKLYEDTGYYEGYIYIEGGFIQTIRGVYKPGTELVLAANVEDKSFTIQDDVWRLDEYDGDAFDLAR